MVRIWPMQKYKKLNSKIYKKIAAIHHLIILSKFITIFNPFPSIYGPFGQKHKKCHPRLRLPPQCFPFQRGLA